MKNLMAWMMAKQTREEGQGMVEYALILVLIAVAAVVGLPAVAGAIDGAWTSVSGLFA